MKVSLKLAVDNLQIVGKYEMDGTILVLPIQGKGDFNLTASKYIDWKTVHISVAKIVIHIHGVLTCSNYCYFFSIFA